MNRRSKIYEEISPNLQSLTGSSNQCIGSRGTVSAMRKPEKGETQTERLMFPLKVVALWRRLCECSPIAWSKRNRLLNHAMRGRGHDTSAECNQLADLSAERRAFNHTVYPEVASQRLLISSESRVSGHCVCSLHFIILPKSSLHFLSANFQLVPIYQSLVLPQKVPTEE